MIKFIKEMVLFFFVLFILSGSGSAISTDLKESYQPGETIITEIRGNILEPIVKEDIEFRRGHVSVPFDFEVKKLGEGYFLWALSPKMENNYTILIKNIVTTIQGKTTETTYKKNFSVQGEIIPYSVKPGVVVTTKDFMLTIFLNEDENKIIPVNFLEESNELLTPGENKIDFSISNIEGIIFEIIQIGDYNIPSYIIKENQTGSGEEGNENVINDNEDIIKKEFPKFRFKPRFIQSRILSSGPLPLYPFKIINSEGKRINVILDFNEDLFLIDSNKEIFINPGETIELNLSLKRFPREDINETIYAHSGDLTLEFPINVEFTQEEGKVSTPYLEENFDEHTQYYCSELSGIICTAKEVCSEETVPSLDGTCCLGLCSEEKKSNSLAWVGYLLAGIIILAS